MPSPTLRSPALTRLFAPLLLVAPLHAFTPATSAAFATFGNEATKALIKPWQPQTVADTTGDVILPTTQQNLQRYVRARILLETEEHVGCICTFEHGREGSMSVFVCRFTPRGHQLLVPLWYPETSAGAVFRDLIRWHKDNFGVLPVSGATLEWESDREAWAAGVAGSH